jgi:hypothetical protein
MTSHHPYRPSPVSRLNAYHSYEDMGTCRLAINLETRIPDLSMLFSLESAKFRGNFDTFGVIWGTHKDPAKNIVKVLHA